MTTAFCSSFSRRGRREGEGREKGGKGQGGGLSLPRGTFNQLTSDLYSTFNVPDISWFSSSVISCVSQTFPKWDRIGISDSLSCLYHRRVRIDLFSCYFSSFFLSFFHSFFLFFFCMYSISFYSMKKTQPIKSNPMKLSVCGGIYSVPVTIQQKQEADVCIDESGLPNATRLTCFHRLPADRGAIQRRAGATHQPSRSADFAPPATCSSFVSVSATSVIVTDSGSGSTPPPVDHHPAMS